MTSQDFRLPRAVESENAIFSVLLNNQEMMSEVSDKLKTSDFYEITSQQIWKAMNNLYTRGQDLDVVSLHTELKQTDVDVEGAIKQIGECYENFVTATNLDTYVGEVLNASLLRQALTITAQCLEETQLKGVKANDLIVKLEKDLVRISERINDNRPIYSKGILAEIAQDLKDIREGGWKGFSTGFEKLDDQTGGFMHGHVWVIGAYTGTGKTFFVLQLILNVLSQQAKVVLFSTEMDRKMNMMRLLANLAQVGSLRIMKGQLADFEQDQVKEAWRTLLGYGKNLTIYDTIYSAEEIRLKVKKQKLEHGVDIVVVDFIQNLAGPENIYERMSKASIELQKIAQELKVTMVITSQVSNMAATWQKKEAIEFKGAGEIAAIADVAVWISKDKDKGQDLRTVGLRKVRHGSPGFMEAKLEFPSGRFVPLNGGVDKIDKEAQIDF